MILNILALSFDDFFQDISKGIFNSPLKVFLVITIITVLAAAVLIYLQIHNNKNKKQLSAIYKKKYLDLMIEFGITDEEKKLIEKLTSFLRNPDKKYLLLLKSHIFHSAVKHLSKKEHIKDSLINPLLVKLEFNNISFFSVLMTTHDMPDGMPVYAVINNTLKFKGKVFREQEFLKIVIEEDPLKIANNSPSIIYTHNNSGIYSFRTQLVKYEQHTLYFLHSSKIKTSQRRFFFRKKVNIAVHANKIHDKNNPVSLIMYDLSAGGAVLSNPDLKFKPGDDIIIYFSDTQKYLLNIDAEVVRASKKQSLIHVKFSDLKPGIQDRIVRLVNKNCKIAPE